MHTFRGFPPTSTNRADEGDGNILYVAFQPDGRSFVAVSQDGRVNHWQLDGTLIHSFNTGYSAPGQPMADLSSDGTLLLVATMEGKQSLWSLKGERLAELSDSSGYLLAPP